ncbi:MAG: hypothetical protein R3A12_04295 [Ignavibacteria bacterium]
MNIFNKSDLRKYFIRDDALKTIVSIVTGIFIIYFPNARRYAIN